MALASEFHSFNLVPLVDRCGYVDNVKLAIADQPALLLASIRSDGGLTARSPRI